MDQTAILTPFFSMMLLTIVVWCYMYAKRIPFIQRSNLKPEQLTAIELNRISPPDVINPSDNLKNLFELPAIFYALVLVLLALEMVDTTFVVAAWIFVAFRVLHSLVHCTVNIILLRFGLYVVSSLALFFMVLRATWLVVSG